MAIFKPESSGTYTDYLGICEFAIMDFKDKSADFDWADIFIEVIVRQMMQKVEIIDPGSSNYLPGDRINRATKTSTRRT